MSYQDFGVAIAVISLAVALTGAVMSRRALRRATYRTATDFVLQGDRIFLERPELRPFLYDEKQLCPAKEDPLYGRVMAAAEFYLDILEAIWDHRDEFSRVDRVAWREWIHDLLEWSQALRAVYEEEPRWYPTITSLLEWEPCSLQHEHGWAAGKPGSTGKGVAFKLKRALRHAPLIGDYVRR